MLKTRGRKANRVFRELRAQDSLCHAYVSLIHEFYPKEELNQYGIGEWRSFAKSLGVADRGDEGEIRDAIRQEVPDYPDKLRTFFAPV